jgi:hypothetical protein
MIHRDEPVLVLDRLARPDERQARRPPRDLLKLLWQDLADVA